MAFGTAVFATGTFSATRSVTLDFTGVDTLLVDVFSEGSVADAIGSCVIDPGGAAIAMTGNTEYTPGLQGAGGSRGRSFNATGLSLTGVKTVTVTCGGASGKPTIWAQPCTGYSAATTGVNATFGGSPFSSNISSAAGHTVVAMVRAYVHGDGSPLATTSGATILKRVLSTDAGASVGGIWSQAGAATATVSGTWTSSPLPSMVLWDLTPTSAPAPAPSPSPSPAPAPSTSATPFVLVIGLDGKPMFGRI